MEVKVKFKYEKGIRIVDEITVSVKPPELIVADVAERIREILEVKLSPKGEKF